MSATPELSPHARRRNLSVEAYLNDLEASRRWKREHPERHFSPCSCGQRKSRKAEMCRSCANQAAALREEMVLELRGQGLTNRAIGEAMGLSEYYVGNIICRMRKRGVDVPPSPWFVSAR